jgi:hypothetical protein
MAIAKVKRCSIKRCSVKRCSSITKKGTQCKNNALPRGVKCPIHKKLKIPRKPVGYKKKIKDVGLIDRVQDVFKSIVDMTIGGTPVADTGVPNKAYNDAYKSKMYLEKYEVKYDDPTNFIYAYNGKKMDDYIENGEWNYPSLLKLYMKSFNIANISIDTSDLSKVKMVTSVPIFPNMVGFHAGHNHFTSFPIQPKMEKFSAYNGKLISFPSQPKMRIFTGQKNDRLTSFANQPAMTHFYGEEGVTDPLSHPNLKFYNGKMIRTKAQL